MLPTLTIEGLLASAKDFCQKQSKLEQAHLYDINDSKSIGTYIERSFQEFLTLRYDLQIGKASKGLDLPSIRTDIKATSLRQPQSSCPYKSVREKIYGLDYHLLIFVYLKENNKDTRTARLDFVSCTFVDAARTADYQTTTGIRKILQNDGNVDDVFAFLSDHRLPADESTLYALAEEIVEHPPEIGYLTISNALQWRLQYGRVIALSEHIDGITPVVQYDKHA